MIRERIKTALLTVLIVSSVVLSFQIWTSEKLWPEGYDFFSVYPKNFISSLFGGRGKDTVNINVTGALDSVFSPNTVMLSFTDGRVSFNGLQGEGKAVAESLNKILTEALKKEPQPAKENEWQVALMGRSLYADYAVDVGFFEMASFLGSSVPDKALYYNSVVIPLEGQTTVIPVYFRNSAQNSYYKINVDYNISELENMFASLSGTKRLNLSYAYELNLDKQLTGDDSAHQKIIMESYVLLPLDTINMTEIVPTIPDITEQRSVRKIAKALGINLNTSQHFTQTDQKEVYVTSSASLTASKNGYFEFVSSGESTGIKVAEKTDFSGTVAGCAEIIDNILSEFNLTNETRLFINSPLVSNGENKATLYFDYIYEGNPIYMGEGVHGCTVETVDGRITAIKMYIKNFEKFSTGTPKEPLEIIDKIYLMQGGEDIFINELYRGYIYSDSKMTLTWFVKINNQDVITTVE